MRNALIRYLIKRLNDGILNPKEATQAVDEIHRLKRRVVRPRDTSRDHEPIIVGDVR